MFQGFKPEASDFFWELCFNNEREWFHAHKQQYDELIGNPMRDLALETNAIISQRFPLMGSQVHVARIWRDARRHYGRGPLKDNLWFSMKSGSAGDYVASFYFELKPAQFSYGMGFWCAKAEQSENFRKSVDANPAAFARLAEGVASLNRYVLEGPLYAKPKGDYGEVVNAWYNRKWTSACHDENFGGDILKPEFPQILADEFTALMPMYDYLMQHCYYLQD